MDYKFFLYILFIFIVGDNTAVSAQPSSSCSQGGPQDGNYGHGGDSSKLYDNFLDWRVRVTRPADPNEMVGPAGYDSRKWVSVNDRLNYTIRFENDPKTATAPAQNVFIRMPVDAKINISSLQLGEVGFGSFRFAIPPGNSYYATRLDVRDSLGLYVDLTAGIDVINHELFWRFRSIDPVTSLPPANAQTGFLPVNDTTGNIHDTIPGKGEGFVNFTIKPVSIAQTGDTTYEKATIVFDSEQPIETNSWTNTIDAVAPVSHINTASVFRDTVTLNWTGADDANGSGIKEYALYYAESGGVFTLYQQHIANTTIKFVGTLGKTYCFFILTSDNTGNKEQLKTTCEVTAVLPLNVILPISWLYFKGKESGKDALLNWATTSEINTRYFSIERSLDGIRFSEIGTMQAAGNSSITSNYAFTDSNAMNLPVNTLYYRLRQVDADGKFTYSIIISISIKHTNTEPVITAYPNPFSQQITLKIVGVSASDQTDYVALYTVDGKILFQKNIVQRGSATILLDDLPNLKPGIYLLHTSINGKLYTIRMVRK